VDGCAEILADGNTGLLVPPRDPGALGHALNRVATESSLRAALGKAARAASCEYDIDRTVRRIEELYEEVLAERRWPRAA
jgi:glycosyltransferase involved in cell wall biosynthesis